MRVEVEECGKLAASVIQTLSLQSLSDDLSFMSTWSCRPLSMSFVWSEMSGLKVWVGLRLWVYYPLWPIFYMESRNLSKWMSYIYIVKFHYTFMSKLTYLIVWSGSSVIWECAWLPQGCGFDLHSSEHSLWNGKTQAQNQYHIYWGILVYIHE